MTEFVPEPIFLRQLMDVTANLVDPGAALARVNSALQGRLASYQTVPTEYGVPAAPSRGADRWPYVRQEVWARQLSNVGAKINAGNWEYWHRLQDEYGLPKVTECVLYADPAKRWPDRTETELRKGPARDVPTEPPEVTAALKVIAKMGWEAARDKLSLAAVANEQQLIYAVRNNLTIARALSG